MAMTKLLSVEDLRIDATSYPPGLPAKTVTLVDRVSFTLARGKVLGLIGESGQENPRSASLHSPMDGVAQPLLVAKCCLTATTS